MNGLFRKGCVAAGTVVALVAALPGAAAAAPQDCPNVSLSQPFLAWGDSNEYTLLPGETVDNVAGTSWQLSNGAHFVTTTLQDGRVGQVLDLPAGASAVTAPICVNSSNYPSARTMISDVTGSEGIAVYVSYQSGGPWGAPLATGMIKDTWPGWFPSKPIQLHASSLRGPNLAQFTFVAYGGEYRLYNFYVDPRRSH